MTDPVDISTEAVKVLIDQQLINAKYARHNAERADCEEAAAMLSALAQRRDELEQRVKLLESNMPAGWLNWIDK